MSTRLDTLQARVYAIVGVNPDKEANGQYGAAHIIVAINTAIRFIVKSAPPASLGTLVKTAAHVVAVAPASGLYFNKDSATGGRLLSVAKGLSLDDEVEIKPFVEWIRTAKTENMTTTASDLVTYYATELGRKVYIRPLPPSTPTTFVEVYVDDPDDLVNAAHTMSLPDEWKEWVALLAAQIIALNASAYEKMTQIQNMMVGWSAQFKSQYGMNPPTIQAPVAAGKQV